MPWYRGNLHMHSFWSDGLDFPEMIAGWFKCHGYHFTAFTEHDCFQEGEKWVCDNPDTYEGRTLAQTDCIARYRERFGDDWVRTRRQNGRTQVKLKTLSEYRSVLEEPGRFRIFNAEEVTHHHLDGDAFHINVYNHDTPFGSQSTGRTKPEAADKTGRRMNELARSTGRSVFASFNHPNWCYLTTAEEIAVAPSIRFMEMFTALSSCNVHGDDTHVSTERMWDIVLTKRLGEMNQGAVYGLATDDCHFYFDDPMVLERRDGPGRGLGGPGRAWIVVEADELAEEPIFSSIMHGGFYCSSGVSLRNLNMSDRGIDIEIDPVEDVEYVTRFIGTTAGYDPSSEPVTDASGSALHATRRYSADIGRVLSESTGPAARYEFSGDEIYVRAKIISNKPHPLPHRPGDTLCAWTQPCYPAP